MHPMGDLDSKIFKKNVNATNHSRSVTKQDFWSDQQKT